MARKLGSVCIFLGTALIFGALSLFLYNQKDAEQAREASQVHLQQLVELVEENTAQISSGEEEGTDSPILDVLPEIPEELLTAEDLEMTEAEIDGHSYIGYLSIPALNLELPVMANWNYNLLRIAPCRYYGTLRGNDLVLMAHNYLTHFGTISQLKEGDQVVFVDMDGQVTQYEVVAQDILDPYAIDEMTAGDFDLTLFTCTYGGKSRVTVYCDRK